MRSAVVFGREVVCAVVILGFLVLPSMVFAQTTAGGVSAVSCVADGDRLTQDKLDAFLANPSALLPGFQEGGLPLGNATRDLLISSSDTLPDLLALVSSSNQRQLYALASGFARAAFACSQSQPEYARKIQEGVAGLGNDVLAQAFSIALGDIQTAALASAPAAPAPSVSGAPANGAGTKGAGTDETTATTSGTYSFAKRSLIQSLTSGSDVSPSGVGS